MRQVLGGRISSTSLSRGIRLHSILGNFCKLSIALLFEEDDTEEDAPDSGI